MITSGSIEFSSSTLERKHGSIDFACWVEDFGHGLGLGPHPLIVTTRDNIVGPLYNYYDWVGANPRHGLGLRGLRLAARDSVLGSPWV